MNKKATHEKVPSYPSATLIHDVEKTSINLSPTMEVPPEEPKPERAINKKTTIEKRIDVPLNLVGLLLSRKPQLKVTFAFIFLLAFSC
jgi:hypothetical protein